MNYMLKTVTSDKDTIDYLMSAVASCGVKTCIASPGSRNIPLMLAANARIENVYTVIDERVAAFMALGVSEASLIPVALVCTSGTAALNYSSAVAEAYYRRIPLIVITADRPERWINQSDGQTIIQPGIYDNFIKASCDIDGETSAEDNAEIICSLLSEAIAFPQGPVHINVRLDVPLGNTVPVNQRPVIMEKELPAVQPVLPESDLLLKGRIMVIVGDNIRDEALRAALRVLDKMPNVVILAEHNANAGVSNRVANIDEALRVAGSKNDSIIPDVIFTLGGGIIAPGIKKMIRALGKDAPPVIEVCKVPFTRDTYCALKDSWKLSSAQFYLWIKGLNVEIVNSDYRTVWIKASAAATEIAEELFDSNSAAGAIRLLMNLMQNGDNLVLSNGLTVRMAQYFKLGHDVNVSCNRGVSGIDGSTSTALGVAMASPSSSTCLISGDMSFQYDIGALGVIGSLKERPRFKMAVISNQGGHIFRQIAASRNLDVEEWIKAPLCLPLEELAKAYRIPFYRYDGTQESMRRFMEEPDAAIMEIRVDPAVEKGINDLYYHKLKHYYDEKGLETD